LSGLLGDPALDGLALAELVRTGAVSAAELLDECLETIGRLNPALNAVVRTMEEGARRSIEQGLPQGPFAGVPFLLKDLMSRVAGVPLSSGSRFLREWVPEADSELVRRYRAAGFVLAGKTNTPEFGLVPYTEPELFGPTRNPWDRGRTAGGSSGGSAAAVASGMVPIAHGGDGGGSIRIPASCCGLFGLKPTRGRTPCGPAVGESWHGLVVEHVLTRSVRDSAAVLDATAGPDPGAPCVPPPPLRAYLGEVTTEPGPLRIAFTSRPFLGDRVDPECVRGLDETVKLLSSLGHVVEEAAPPVDRDSFSLAFVTMLCGEVRADIEEAERMSGRRAGAADLEPATWALGMLGRSLRAADLSAAVRTLRLASRGIGAFFENWDVLLTPTLASPPVPTGSLQLSSAEKRLIRVLARFDAGWLLRALGLLEPTARKTFEFIPFTPPFNVTGQPAMSVPLHRTAAGLPVGMHFVGRWGDESTLFRLAGQLERALPWATLRPPETA
jgi:amidase